LLVDFLNAMDPTLSAFLGALIKVFVWIVPVILLIKFVEKKSPLSFLGLKEDFRRGLVWAGWISLLLVSYFIVQNLILTQSEWNFNLGFDKWLNVIILVGITEEIVFRGFLLKKLMQRITFWKANTITAFLFLTIHFPIWYRNGLFESPEILLTCMNVLIIGFIFGVIYKKTNSLWSVIIIHSVYNLCISIFM
jgi:uncharacterized protein